MRVHGLKKRVLFMQYSYENMHFFMHNMPDHSSKEIKKKKNEESAINRIYLNGKKKLKLLTLGVLCSIFIFGLKGFH